MKKITLYLEILDGWSLCFDCLKCSIVHTLHYLSFKIGNWDEGTPLGKVVEAASELGVPGLLLVSTCCDELDDLDGDV